MRRGTVAQRVVDHLTHPGHILGMMFRRPHAEQGPGHEAVQDEEAIQCWIWDRQIQVLDLSKKAGCRIRPADLETFVAARYGPVETTTPGSGLGGLTNVLDQVLVRGDEQSRPDQPWCVIGC